MISIIIPVYKNYQMFFKNLEKNKKCFSGCEIIVINDYPQEKIAKKVKEIIPNSVAVDNKKNLGFASCVNSAVKRSKGEFIFLLNSDVVLPDDSFQKSINVFKKDKKIFAITFSQIEADGKLVGANRGYFENGLINHTHQPVASHQQLITNFWAEGGSSIFRRDIFLKLSCFDPLYNPFYWEDVDLSYRAWKSGYKIVFLPDVAVKHQHESTIGRYFDKRLILKIAYRNQFVFNWKNITDTNLLTAHILSLPRLLFLALVKGNLSFWQGFFLALIRLPKIIKSRKKAVKSFIRTDQEILNLFKK